MRPDAILFDMDGVLVDSLDAWWKSLNDAIVKCCGQELSRDEFIKRYLYQAGKYVISFFLLTGK